MLTSERRRVVMRPIYGKWVLYTELKDWSIFPYGSTRRAYGNARLGAQLAVVADALVYRIVHHGRQLRRHAPSDYRIDAFAPGEHNISVRYSRLVEVHGCFVNRRSYRIHPSLLL